MAKVSLKTTDTQIKLAADELRVGDILVDNRSYLYFVVEVEYDDESMGCGV